jgi:hypothetical protein
MKYTRSPACKAKLVDNGKGQILTKENCKIQVPYRYSERGLGEVGVETRIYGCFPVIFENGEYTLCNVTAVMFINPFKTSVVEIDEVEYHQFEFRAGDVVIKNTEVVRDDLLMYNIFDEFIFKGKIPWYMGYEDVGKLFDTAKSHGGSDVAGNYEVIELIASMVTRSKNDRSKYIRSVTKSYADTVSSNIDFVPLSSIFYSVNSTVNKIAGSYFSDGVVSALVTPTTKVDKIESILRA